MSLLPFLNKSAKQSQTVVVDRAPDDKEDKHAPMRACAEDILRAIESKDPTHLALALRAAIDIAGSEEPEQDDEEDAFPHSYEAQKD